MVGYFSQSPWSVVGLQQRRRAVQLRICVRDRYTYSLSFLFDIAARIQSYLNSNLYVYSIITSTAKQPATNYSSICSGVDVCNNSISSSSRFNVAATSCDRQCDHVRTTTCIAYLDRAPYSIKIIQADCAVPCVVYIAALR